MQKVYVEAVFADNFAVNFLILIFACRLCSSRVRWGRCAMAAAVGGVYAAAVYGMQSIAVSLPVKIAVSFAMCILAFWVRGEKHFWKGLIAFYVATFITAGVIYGISLGIGKPQDAVNSLAVTPAVRSVLLGLAAAAGLMGIYSVIRRRALQREPNTAMMELSFGDRRARVKAYIDTGNLVTDPLTGQPVIFLSRGAAENLLGRQCAEALTDDGTPPETEKLRVIPCVTAAGPSVLYGIELGSVSLPGGGTSAKAVACIASSAPVGGCEAIVGINLTDELKKGAYYEKPDGTKDRGVGTAAPEARGARRLHQRQRGAAPASVGGGGGGAVIPSGQGGQDGAAGADRTQSASGGIHRAQV